MVRPWKPQQNMTKAGEQNQNHMPIPVASVNEESRAGARQEGQVETMADMKHTSPLGLAVLLCCGPSFPCFPLARLCTVGLSDF